MKWLASPVVFCLSTLGFAAMAHAAPPPTKNLSAQQPAKKVEAFKPFTGKVLANKVRIRAKADLEGHIVRQANKNDLLLVVAEEGDFYAVQPPKDTKAFVFRSYVLDGIIEANRVNVRLEPHVDAPIIAQLQAGDKVSDWQICAMNHKWLEISPPSTTRFYVSKEFIAQAGGPDYLATMEKRKSQVDEMLSSAFFSAETECKKNYEEMSINEPTEIFHTILRNFSDFPEAVAQAKEGLALLKDTYLNKKISYLESKAELSSSAKEALLAKHKAENLELFANENVKVDQELWGKRAVKKEMTDQMQFWDTVEESLFLSWSAFHAGKKMEDFYAEQKANASVITGTIESYGHPVKNKPGNFILRGEDAPMAYLYSTKVDLEKFAGKRVTMLVSPRPNNHFAFPAYYVLSVE
ncbi:MAG: SH3 domain-containing protein [Verrucomicrobia bacterium]|nr:SH3 domain-containing protein [Verrucomicrobiota bacterium]